MKEIIDYLKAGYAHFFVRAEEMDRTVEELKKVLSGYGRVSNIQVWSFGLEGSNDPLEPLTQLDKEAPWTVAILKNFDWFLKDWQTGEPNYEVVQFILDRLALYRSGDKRRILIILSSRDIGAGLPDVLVREFVSLGFPLPGTEELEEVLNSAIEVAKGKPKFKEPGRAERQKLIDSMRGMTQQEAENALFYSLVKTGGSLDPMLIKQQRVKYLEGTAGVKYVEYEENYEQLKGYEQVKWIIRTYSRPDNPMSKGLLLLGPPGTGKSHFAKATAGEFGMFMLTVEAAEMTGSLVGENEEKVRRFIQIACAMAPCILFFDEIEKALAGLKGGVGYSSDTVNRRAWAPFLKFMQDRRDPDTGEPVHVYLIATCNDISSLPPEYVRAERWDCAPIFVDLPNEMERQEILNHYKEFYGVKGELTSQKTEGWSGAELRAVCRLAKQGGTTIEEASRLILPVSSTMEQEISGLREWAMGGKEWRPGRGRAIPATEIAVPGEKKGRKREIDL